MATYSVAEAKNNLPRLLDEALSGQSVTITRRGVPIAEIVAKPGVGKSPGAHGPYDVDWLRANVVKPKTQDPRFNADVLIRRMRDEGY